jgi:ElaB/YqjD/DUF883 family membrane-anchored ribosome-binding protein
MEKEKSKQISMSELRERKEKLQEELDALENDIEGRISGVQKKLMGNLEPVSIIKRHPFTSVGASILAGLAIGLIGKKGKREETGDSSGVEFSRIVIDEVKKLAAKKAVQSLSDLIDQKLSPESSDKA